MTSLLNPLFFFSLSLSYNTEEEKKNQLTRLYPLRHDSKLEIMRYCREQSQAAWQLLECCLSLWIVLVTRRSSLKSSVLACVRNKWMFASSTARVVAGLGCAGDGSRQFYSCNFWGDFNLLVKETFTISSRRSSSSRFKPKRTFQNLSVWRNPQRASAPPHLFCLLVQH